MLRRQIWLELCWRFVLLGVFGAIAFAFWQLVVGGLPAPLYHLYKWTLIPVAGVLLLQFLNHLIRNWYPLRRHWIYRRLQWFGPAVSIARAIDRELSADHIVVRGRMPRWLPWTSVSQGFTTITRNWILHFEIVRRMYPRFVAIHLNRVIWVYKQYLVPYDPVGMPRVRYGIAFWYDWGASEVLEMPKESSVDALMERLIRRKPEVLVGFVGDLIEWRRTDPTRLRACYHEHQAQLAEKSNSDRVSWIHDQLATFDDYPRRIDLNQPYARFVG